MKTSHEHDSTAEMAVKNSVVNVFGHLVQNEDDFQHLKVHFSVVVLNKNQKKFSSKR